ncbi:MAG: hypothetical protein HDT47_10590 [Ruminococcaceae bacterium]|nr:hypothetical protein [Oscillospiraceae bacterium]
MTGSFGAVALGGGAAGDSPLKCGSISKFSPLGENLAPPLLWGSYCKGAVLKDRAAQRY